MEDRAGRHWQYGEKGGKREERREISAEGLRGCNWCSKKLLNKEREEGKEERKPKRNGEGRVGQGYWKENSRQGDSRIM